MCGVRDEEDQGEVSRKTRERHHQCVRGEKDSLSEKTQEGDPAPPRGKPSTSLERRGKRVQKEEGGRHLHSTEKSWRKKAKKEPRSSQSGLLD